jgi:hypothetical protein
MAFGSAAAFFGLDQMSAGIGRVLTGHAQRTFTGRALDLSIGDPASAETLAMYASVAAAAGGAALQAIPTVGTTAMALTGQLHHVISNKIAAALARHPTLSGYYQARDPRLVTQAVNRAAHNGYETWHRLLDAEVIEWLSRNQSATPMEFEAWLRWRYSLPDLIWRFPNGF